MKTSKLYSDMQWKDSILEGKFITENCSLSAFDVLYNWRVCMAPRL